MQKSSEEEAPPLGALRMPPLVLLYGPPGSGKSSLGRELANRLELPFLDLDERISAQAGQSIAEIFAQSGEAAFRRLESQALGDTLQVFTGVVALGGGALLDAANRREAERAGQVLYLDASYETLLRRMHNDSRPLLQGDTASRLQALLAQRGEHYTSFRDRLDTSSLSLDEAAWQAQIVLGRFQAAGMGAAGSAGSYPIWTQRAALDQLGSAMRNLGLRGRWRWSAIKTWQPITVWRLLTPYAVPGTRCIWK